MIWIPWFSDNAEIARILLDKGAEVNFVSVEGVSPMNLAVFNNRVKLIDLFLEKGAKMPSDEKEISAFMEASVSSGNLNLFNKLIRAGGNIFMKNKFDGTLIHNAAKGGAVQMITLLHEKGVSLEKTDRYGLTPLHIAASRGKTDIVRLLIEEKVDLKARSANGKSALNFADENNHTEITDILKLNGMNTDRQQFPVFAGDYAGQPVPGTEARLFAPGIISQNRNEHSMLTISPDGSEIYWSPEYGKPILCMRWTGTRWNMPEPVSFSYKNLDSEPVVSPDGSKLFFLSRRPLNKDDKSEKERIWYVGRVGNNWSKPQVVNPEITTHWQISADKNGSLYFGGPGKTG